MNNEFAVSPERGVTSPDLLIVLGKNIGVDSTVVDIQDNRWNLSVESRLNVLAAGELYQPGMQILFSTGKTAGEDTPSEAAAMYSYFKRFFPTVPGEDILLDEASIDTASNAAEVSKLLKDRHYDRIGLLSVDYHVDNARTLFTRYGVAIDQTFASNEVIKNRSHHHEAYALAWASLDRVKSERKKEMVRKVLLHTFDRKGKALQQVTKRSRK
jgi:uncharacterized SAM-binding protein YcdF (DUF218 family)